MYARAHTRFGALCRESGGSPLRGPMSFKDSGWDGVNRMFLAQWEKEFTEPTEKSAVARKDLGKLNFIALMKMSCGSSAPGKRRVH